MQVCNENPLPSSELLPIAPRTHKLNDPPQQDVTSSNDNIIKTLSYTRNNWIVFCLHICIQFFICFIVSLELLLRKLNMVVSKLTSIETRLTQLEAQTRARRILTEDVDDIEDEVNLPLKTLDQLEEFENKLKNNAFLAKMVVVATKTGGNTVNTATAAVLKKILDNILAEEFSWDGKKKKKEFKVLLTAKVLRKAVHSMCQPDCTDLQIKTVASQWLAQAKIRRV